jgi:hypothetical protein
MFFLLLGVNSYPQNNKKNISPDHNTDYNIVSSNNSYIEIDYYPKYTSNNNFDFYNSIRKNTPGYPDLGMRSFSVILPTDKNNKAEIIDYKYSDINNQDVLPVPTLKKSNNKFEALYDYIKNDKVYNQNSFFPVSFIKLEQNGIVRNKYFGSLDITPCIYNPLNKTLRKLSYIKIRIYFGGSPIYSNKKMSKEELNLFSGIAINSKNAINWSTLEFNNLKSNPVLVNSVLASGDFYKMEVKETGVYKIDKNYLQQAGINVSGINPSTIKIYGNGGQELPFQNSTLVPTDLVENPIYIKTEVPGQFGNNDYILFFGVSPNDWKYDSIQRKYFHYINHYSNSNYYWLTFGGSNGLRMQELNSPSLQGLTPLSYFRDKIFDEPEISNLGSTGNLWLSQMIALNESFVFNKELKGYQQGSDIDLRLRYGNGSTASSFFAIKDDNSSLSVLKQVYGIPIAFSHINLTYDEYYYPLNSNFSSINIRLSLPSQYGNNAGSSGYYDYYEVEYNRNFNSADNNVIRFNSPDTLSAVEYNISPFSTQDLRIFNISNRGNVNLINPISFTSGSVRFQDNILAGSPKEYIIIGGNNYKTPASISQKIPNQNIQGISDGASFVIISPTEFLPAANRLKAHRETPDINYLKTFVFDINQIYNEFSGGLVDPLATRNFLKYSYNNWNEKPLYVLFLGDGSFDFKNIYNLNVKNYLPPVEKTEDDMNEILSYNSDDFLMDINENFTKPGYLGIGRPDFSTGRICVNSLSEANTVIDKIISYESTNTNDIWKKKIMYVADDGWTTENFLGQEGDKHTRQCEDIAEYYTPKDYEKEKIYIVTYPTVITPLGRRKPGANVDIIKGWNEGRLVINYVGHGSVDLWAHEHIFVRSESIPQLNNKDKYPLVTIASCDLARWDDPSIVSAGEQLVFEPDRGAIGVIAAVRPVYSDPNAIFNNALWSNFMYVKDTLNLPIRIGKAMFYVKNQLSSLSDNDAKFCLIGDPTLRVSLPEYFTRIDSINNVGTNDTATIKALQKVKISGSILKPDSTFWNNYNGELILKVFDVDKYIDFVDFGYHFNFRLDGGSIFKGKTNVLNGKWQIEFIVPKDISYNTGNGKILAYFKNSSTQGSGYSNKFILNGIDTTAISDTLGPDITVFMGDRNFRTGDLINQNTKIIADFFDFNGINLTGTIGHKIEGIINDDENNKLDLTSYFNSTNSYQYGSLEYPLQQLADGKYNLKIKAWDTYNNYSIKSIDFTVKSNTALRVDNIYNYPNPMKDFTSFVFNHNFDSPLNVIIKIYTVSGKLIKEIDQNNISDKYVMINWDGRDTDGDNIANGTYLYKMTIKTTDGTFSTTNAGKLAKLK